MLHTGGSGHGGITKYQEGYSNWVISVLQCFQLTVAQHKKWSRGYDPETRQT